MSANSVWRAVSDPTRRRLIDLLRGGPRTTGELCREFPTTRFAVMKHLAVLERCGVVKVRRAGRQRWNELDPGPLREVERPGPSGAEGHGPSGVDGAPAVDLRVFLDAPPWRVFDALTMNLAAWWGAPHLLAGDATNLVIEPQPGGRFYEEWGHRQGALRGVVVAIKQDERVEVEGAVFGGGLCRLGFSLERREGGTLVTAAWTGAPAGTPARAEAAAILGDLVRSRLKAFVERGERTGVGA
jgi:DNA-binding transcriptional ArsR family regulator/uncharacterized protein YndB with AHSA1/START domain